MRNDTYPNNLNTNQIINDDIVDRMSFAKKTFPSHFITEAEEVSPQTNKHTKNSSNSHFSNPPKANLEPGRPLKFQMEPRRDYFCCTALIDIEKAKQLSVPQQYSSSKGSFPLSGFSINIHVAVQDQFGDECHVGPDLSLPVQIIKASRK